MRILIVCESYLSMGGVAELVDSLAGAFIHMGHHVAVVSHPFEFAAGARATRSTAEHFTIRIPRVQPPTWRHPERLIRGPQADELLSLLRRWRPDVANLHEPLWERTPASFKACRVAGVPTVLSLHDLVNQHTPKKTAARALKLADSICFLSAATRTSFVPLSASVRDSPVILCGVDCDGATRAPPFPRTRPYVFCAARINLQHKALDVLVRAFAIIAGHYPDLDLLFTGDGTDREALAQIVDRLGLRGRIEFLGVRSREELWSLHKGSILFAMPSRKPEGLGLAFLEAMACGRPVIGTNSGGTPEVVRHEETGLLTERNEPEEIADAFRCLLDNPEQRERMGRRARELVMQYDWSAVGRRYLEVYQAVALNGHA